MNNNQMGESMGVVIQQMIPFLKNGVSTKTPVMEMSIHGRHHQVVLQLVPIENGYLNHGEIMIENKDEDGSISLTP